MAALTERVHYTMGDYKSKPDPLKEGVPRQHKDWIDRLTRPQRTLYLAMLMDSIRGSWTSPERRQAIIEHLVALGRGKHHPSIATDEDFYETLRAKAERYGEKVRDDDQYNDGRYYRGSRGYGGIFERIDPSYEDVRYLSYHIPDDESWGEFGVAHTFTPDGECRR